MITAWIIISILYFLNVILTIGLLVAGNKNTSVSELFAWLAALCASLKVVTLLI